MARNIMGFRQAAEYVYLNEDMSFLDNDEPGVYMPVSCALIADIFDRTASEFITELLKHHSND